MDASRTLMAALAHEVRNLTSAAASLYDALEALPGLPQNKDFQTLRAVLRGLERIATSGLSAGSDRATATANLYTVVDEARIILEPSFRKAGVRIAWRLAEELPTVQGDHHSLLQVFINLARNSLRAMPAAGAREFSIEAAVQRALVLVHVRDTGSGVAEPENLFRPFRSGAGGAGLGLYVSRAILRPYGGDLRYEAQPQGSCFVVELCPVGV